MSAGTWTLALGAAWPAWQQAIGQQGWQAGLVGLAYGSVGLLCAARGHASRHAFGHGLAWKGAAVALIAIALTGWLAVDRLLVGVMRHVALAQGWYAERRAWQGVVITLCGIAAVAALRAAKPRLASADAATRWAATGLGLVLAVALLRGVSLHATDLWLQTRLAGLSVGRWVEALGLCGIAAAATRTWPVNGR